MTERMIRNVIPLLKLRTARALLATLVAAGAPSFASADEAFHLYSDPPSGSGFAEMHWADPPAPRIDFTEVARLDSFPAEAAFENTLPADGTTPQRPQKLFTTATTVWTAAAIGAGVLQ